MQLKTEVDKLTAWLKAAQTARDSAERAWTGIEGLSTSLSAESQLQQQVEAGLASRVRSYGEEAGHFMTDDWMTTGKSIQAAAENRFKGVLAQLDAATSLLHFASLELEALTLRRNAISNALTAKRFFIYHINSLPNELLLKIFQEVVSTEVATRNQTALGDGEEERIPRAVVSPLHLGAVSSRWRELTCTCAELWSAVSLILADPRPSSQRILDRQLQRMQYYLQNSKNSELNLVVYYRRGGDTDLGRVLEPFTAALSRRSIAQSIINTKHLDMCAAPGGGAAAQTARDLPDLQHLLAQLPSARILKLTPLRRHCDHNTAEFLFVPPLASLSSCTSFTCFGIRPMPPNLGAQTVRHLSISRTSTHVSWDLNAILSSFPNLTHLDMDSALAGCVEGLNENPEVHECTLLNLKRVTTSLTGLDDLNKSVQRRLSLPSFEHLTLADVSSRDRIPLFVWITFSASEYAAKLTTLEVMECSAFQFIDLHALSILNTLKLHSKAVRYGLKSFALEPSAAEDPLPASLKEIYLFNPNISGGKILQYIKQIRSNSISHKWTYPSRLHLSGHLNITKASRSSLEDEGDYYVHLFS